MTLPEPNAMMFLGAAEAEPVWNEQTMREYAAAAVREAVAAEREACAKVCDGIGDSHSEDEWLEGFYVGAGKCADAIRARKD